MRSLLAISIVLALGCHSRVAVIGEPTSPGAVLHLLLSKAGFRQVVVLDSTITVSSRDWRWVVDQAWADSVRDKVREALKDLELAGRTRIALNRSDLAGTRARPIAVSPGQSSFAGPEGLTLISFSPLGFSSDSSVSVIYWTYFCGALCAGGDVSFFVRSANGSWVPLRSVALFRS